MKTKKRREPQGRRGPMQRTHKARQPEADKERVAGKAGRSSQPTRPPPRKDKALPDNQPHTDGCGPTPGSGHLPPTVTPASNTHTAAGRSSGAVEIPPGKWQEEKSAHEKVRAEKAERLQLQVDKKRKEQEEQKWKKKEQQEQMEKVKADLEKEQQRNAEKMELVRIMFSFEKRTFEWNDDTELL
ncbi:uncharacterized protein KIAA2012 homolog [Aquila chrysaetos chrysaetos]|uniref:uncharacterized protein KIAA2012 homolog n=1 Tax=Aquila chrysaetos chrysaetos TaxID=223781 RepID=UPI001B7D3791|nr:uncharacterized protein KIAA2012 homolog [Aquila chrysaetos chrysaetos]